MGLESHVAFKSSGVSKPTADAALDFAKSVDDRAWTKVRSESRDRTRIRFGPQQFYRGQSAGAKLPPALHAMANEALESIRADLPAELVAKFRPNNCVVNQYFRSGVAAHRDPSDRWLGLVLGVTLYEDPSDPVSSMKFTSLPGAESAEVVKMPTPHRSVYAFFDDAFLNAKHARMPCGKRQTRKLYSFTFRCGLEECNA